MAPKPTDSDPLSATLLAFTALLETYILPVLPAPVAAILRAGLNTISSLPPYLFYVYNTFISFTTSLLSKRTSSSTINSMLDSPEATTWITTLIMLGTTYMAFVTLNYVRRSIMSWFFFFVKLAVLLVLVQCAWYINAYGLNKFLGDVFWYGDFAWRMIEEAIDGPEAANNPTRIPKGLQWRKNAGKR